MRHQHDFLDIKRVIGMTAAINHIEHWCGHCLNHPPAITSYKGTPRTEAARRKAAIDADKMALAPSCR